MEKLGLTFLAVFLYLNSIANCLQYHYDKPQTPFVTGGNTAAVVPAKQTQQQTTTTYYVVKSPGGKEFKVHVSPSKKIYESVQSGGLAAPNNIGTPHYAGGYGAQAGAAGNIVAQATPNVNPLTHGQYAHGTTGTSSHKQTVTYVIQSQHNAASGAQHQQNAYNTQQYASANVGTAAAVGNGQYGAPSASGGAQYSAQSNAGAGAHSGHGIGGIAAVAGAQYGAAFVGGGNAYNGQGYAGTAGTQYGAPAVAAPIAYNGQSYGGANVATSAAGAQYGAPYNGQQYAAANGAQYSAPSYGGASTYNSQQYTGANYGGAAATSGAQHGSAILSGQIGDYTAQSQVGQLDHYSHKQQTPGDTRGFTRIVTTCSPSGHCERVTLSPGQVDPAHERLLAEQRARITPTSDKCKRIDAAATANSIGGSGKSIGIPIESVPNRPKDRRLFAYTETVQQRDPFN